MICNYIEKITGIKRDPKDSGAAGVIGYAADILLWLAVSFYLVVTAVMLPLYLPGYERLGSDKGLFWIRCIVISGKLLLAVIAVYAISFLIRLFAGSSEKKSLRSLFPRKIRIYATDVLSVLFCVSVIISYSLSDDKTISLYGEKGWYLGLCAYLALGAGVIVITRMRSSKSFFIPVMLAGSFAVSLFGIILEIFGDVFKIEGWSEGRISTIGNANWFCGYLITVMFISVAAFYARTGKESKREKYITAALIIYMMFAFYMFVAQGSASGYPALYAVVLALTVMAGKDLKALLKVSLTVLIWSGCVWIHAVYVCLGGSSRANDMLGNTLDKMIPATLLFAAAIALTYYLASQIKKGRESIRVNAGLILTGISVSVLLIYLMLLVINTLSGAEYLGDGFFFFGSEWGSNRGATMSVGFDLFRGMTPMEKLFGKGPDNFYSLLSSGRFPEAAAFSYEYFSGARLTNAHCEPLTMLVNTGILGTFSFYGLLILIMVKGFRKKTAISENGKIAALACSLCILAYIINNIFSFQTSVNVSQLSVILGFGAWNAVRNDKSEER